MIIAERLLCVGLTTLDILGRPIDALPEEGRTKLVEEIALAPAGTAGGMALVAAALGLPTALASAVGDDAVGRFVRTELEARGVNTRLLAAEPGTRTSATILTIRSDGQRPNFHALGASSRFALTDDVTEAAKAAKFVHWGAVGGARVDGGPGAALLATAKTAGATVICDLIGPNKRTMDELARLLPHVDYFMPNMGEALQLAGTTEPRTAADRFLAMGARACIFKWGERGSYIAERGEAFTLSAHAIDVVDTTSCGDSYCAGFVAALDRGFTLRDACRFATATAALVAQGLGTLGKLVDFDTTLSYMRTAPLAEAA